jgi:hypothetical protein
MQLHWPLPLTTHCRLGAFGFANDTKDLMKEMDSATNYLKLLKSSTV